MRSPGEARRDAALGERSRCAPAADLREYAAWAHAGPRRHHVHAGQSTRLSELEEELQQREAQYTGKLRQVHEMYAEETKRKDALLKEQLERERGASRRVGDAGGPPHAHARARQASPTSRSRRSGGRWVSARSHATVQSIAEASLGKEAQARRHLTDEVGWLAPPQWALPHRAARSRVCGRRWQPTRAVGCPTTVLESWADHCATAYAELMRHVREELEIRVEREAARAKELVQRLAAAEKSGRERTDQLVGQVAKARARLAAPPGVG
jgi:hypothetical protein